MVLIPYDNERLRRINELPSEDVQRICELLPLIEKTIFWNVRAPKGIFYLGLFALCMTPFAMAYLPYQHLMLVLASNDKMGALWCSVAVLFIAYSIAYVFFVDWRGKVAFQKLKVRATSDRTLGFMFAKLIQLEPYPPREIQLRKLQNEIFNKT